MNNDNYISQPFDRTISELPEELINITEKIAKNVHDVWMKGRIKEGWTYGPERSDREHKHPYLIPYEKLAESEKDIDRNTAIEILRMINKLGFKTNNSRTIVQEWEDAKVEKIVSCINDEEHSIVPVVGMSAFYVQNDNQEPLQEFIVREIVMRYISKGKQSAVFNCCRKGDIKSMTKLSKALKDYGNDNYFDDEMDIYQCVYDLIREVKNNIFINPQVKDFLLYGKFPLIITTCYVDILSNLLVGPNGKFYMPVSYLGHGDVEDLKVLKDSPKREPKYPTIFHLFGKITSNSEPVIDEDDFLKYLHCLHDTSHQPKELKKYLEDRQILIVGCNIPDWTFRFMLHSLKEREGRFVVHGKRKHNFMGGAINPIIEDDLADFLSEIKYIYGNNVSKILGQINTKIKLQKVFISYSAQQGTPIWSWIETFRKKLEPSSIVWLFPEQSKGTYGERYWDLIQKGVEQCDLFIPIITERILSILEEKTFGAEGPVEDSDPGFLCEWARFLNTRRNDGQVRCIPYIMEGNISRLRDIIDNPEKNLTFLRPLFNGAQYIDGDPANFDPSKIDVLGGTLLNI